MSDHVGPENALAPGDRIVIRTPDRREFRGVLTEVRNTTSGVVRLDTGWVTTFPLALMSLEKPPTRSEPDRSEGPRSS
jgi:hypothetical protein